MKKGINVVVDAFWGSSGKGKISAVLADRHDVRYVSAANYPNAGHTVRIGGKKRIFKALPSAAALGNRVCLIAGDSGTRVEQLEKEIHENQNNSVIVHERAWNVTDEHATSESSSDGLRRISSTMQGSAAALCEKISRTKEHIFPKSHLWAVASPEDFRSTIYSVAQSGYVLHEVSQGAALSVNHGTHYPNCTSRDCIAASAFEDLGQPPQLCGDVYLVVRTFPIRVGNLIENGTQVGYSGDFMDGAETTWQEVATNAGMPADRMAELLETETTTVTKRQRRVSEISWSWLATSAQMNGATKIVVTFAEYLDWGARGCTNKSALPTRVRAFIECCQEVTNVPVSLVSTGPDHLDVVWM